jgi:hypothetical protein
MKEENYTDECLGYLTKTCKGIETLEEVAEKYVEINVAKNVAKLMYKEHFVEGAKWQQERSYSEEDIKEAFRVGFNVGYNDETSPSYLTFEQWFEQFKKK